jgi:hypothetical protein
MDGKNRNSTIISITFALAAVLVASCSYHEDKISKTGTTPQTGPGPTLAQKATFGWIQANVLKPNCMGCHSENASSSASAFPFDSYESLMDCKFVLDDDPLKAPLYQSLMPTPANRVRHMPPRRQLGDDLIAPIAEWIKKGAPKN